MTTCQVSGYTRNGYQVSGYTRGVGKPGQKKAAKKPTKKNKAKKKPADVTVKVVVETPPATGGSAAPTPPAPKPSAKVGTTHIVFVVDESGSMGAYSADVPRVLNEQFDVIAKEFTGQDARVSLAYFTSVGSNHYAATGPMRDANKVNRWIFRDVSAGDLRRYRDVNFRSTNGTPLRDAIGEAILELDTRPNIGAKDTAALVVILTDGEENESKQFDVFTLKNLIQNRQGTDRWTFAMLVPESASVAATTNATGVPEGNIKKWAQTKKGYEESNVQTQCALASYAAVRSTGKTSTKAFWAPDLSKLTLATVEKKLDEKTNQFVVWPIEHEKAIQAFVQEKLLGPKARREAGVDHNNYEIGKGFYEFTKDERRIEPYKEIVVMDRGSQRIFGGPNVRAVLGAPDETVPFVPGNNGTWRIFIQSMKPNRLLVRGSDLLYKKS